MVTAGDIPESITVDISELQIGDNATIANVKLPAGAKPTIDRDFVIAQVSAPSGLASQSDDDEDEAAEEVTAEAE
jgi:large subunit ribosomal protein L25